MNITQETKKNNGELFYKLYFGSVGKNAAIVMKKLQPSQLPSLKERGCWMLCYQQIIEKASKVRNNSAENQAIVLILSAAKAQDFSQVSGCC